MSVTPVRLRSTFVLAGRPGEPREELSGGLGDRIECAVGAVRLGERGAPDTIEPTYGTRTAVRGISPHPFRPGTRIPGYDNGS
jgi:hypothetical protein